MKRKALAVLIALLLSPLAAIPASADCGSACPTAPPASTPTPGPGSGGGGGSTTINNGGVQNSVTANPSQTNNGSAYGNAAPVGVVQVNSTQINPTASVSVGNGWACPSKVTAYVSGATSGVNSPSYALGVPNYSTGSYYLSGGLTFSLDDRNSAAARQACANYATASANIAIINLALGTGTGCMDAYNKGIDIRQGIYAGPCSGVVPRVIIVAPTPSPTPVPTTAPTKKPVPVPVIKPTCKPITEERKTFLYKEIKRLRPTYNWQQISRDTAELQASCGYSLDEYSHRAIDGPMDRPE